MTNETCEWDMDGFDAVVGGILVPIALASFLIFALAVGLKTNAASANPKSPKFHFALNQVEAGCINGNGAFTARTGPGGYECTGSGGILSCTARGNCAFTPKLRGLKISRNTTIENLIRS
jgi:hypothetical protein